MSDYDADEQAEAIEVLHAEIAEKDEQIATIRSQLTAAVERAEKAEAERDEARRERDVFSYDSLTQSRDQAIKDRDAARAQLALHQTAPDPNDPDGWIRRSALNHWVARATRAEAALAEVERERDTVVAEKTRKVGAGG